MKNYRGKEVYHRINYLYQLSHALKKCEENKCTDFISTYYSNLVITIAKKGVIRLDPTLKRTICKGCHGLLIPGKTAIVRKKKKPQNHMSWKCKKCFTLRTFNVKKDCQIWTEKEESIAGYLE